MKTNTKTLLLSIAIPLIGGGLVALLTSGSMEIFQEIAKPPLSPPGWLFPVVWTVLYILMGAASYLVISSGAKGAAKALRAYGAQLLFNLVWPFLFFELGAYWLSFVWLIALLVLIIITAVQFYRISKPAGLLMIPYIIWVAFAAYLNLAVAILN